MDIKIGKQEGGGNLGATRATVWFWSAVITFVGVWALIPSILHPAYKADVIELQFIAKEWVWATVKHPMLSAWLLEIVNILTGRAFAAPFIASALCTIIIFFSVWQVAKNVLSERLALVAMFVMMPCFPLTLKFFLYNPNTVLMLFWALTTFTFYYAFQTNKKRWWIAAGLALGLGFHAKYAIAILVPALLFYSLWFPKFRRYWRESGPWLTILTAFIVFLPHLIWLSQLPSYMATSGNVFSALGHNAASTQSRYLASGWLAHLTSPLLFALAWVGLSIVSPILMLVPTLGWRWKWRTVENETEKETLNYLLCCIGIPFLIFILVSGAAAMVRTTYGFPLWFFLGTYLLLRFQHKDCSQSFIQTVKWTSFAVSVFVVVFIIQSIYDPHITGKPGHINYPMHEIGAECDRIWYDRFDTPCLFVVSTDYALAGFAAYTMRDRPSVHSYDFRIGVGLVPMGTWSSDEDVNKKGGLILWNLSRSPEPPVPDWVHQRFPRAEVLPEILELPFKTSANIPPLRIGIAVIPPPEG